MVSTHSRPKAAGADVFAGVDDKMVSTHSRPKAAGSTKAFWRIEPNKFQHTAARRRLGNAGLRRRFVFQVSTHSRPKAAGSVGRASRPAGHVSTHSRPKAAGTKAFWRIEPNKVSTHSRPKAAGLLVIQLLSISLFQHTAARRRLVTSSAYAATGAKVSTHSRPKAAGLVVIHSRGRLFVFQHTAARRRLAAIHGLVRILPGFNTQPPEGGWVGRLRRFQRASGFNTQPPEGGWQFIISIPLKSCLFQHTAARRRLASLVFSVSYLMLFQHTAARRRLGYRIPFRSTF